MSEGMGRESFLHIGFGMCIIGKKTKEKPGMGMEYERKFRAEEEIQEKLLGFLSGSREEFRMKTTYFDTLDGALSSRKWTLRCRQENERSVCTLKTPGQGNARGEWEVSAGEIRESIDMLCKLGAPEELRALCAEGLKPVCGAEFTRTAITVSYGESLLEVALDRGVLTGGGKTAPIAEVEVELKQGSIADADGFANVLCQKFGLTEEPDSKFRRALALYRGEK